MRTIANLTDELANAKGATIVSLTTATTPKLLKTGNPFLDTTITKVVSQSCQFGYSYENAVNNRLENEVGTERNFVAESLPWGKWLVPNKLITYRGNLYGRFYTMPNANMEVAYFVGNRLATKEETEVILSLSSSRSESARQSEFGLTEHQVKPMSIKLSSIVSLTMNEGEYNCEALKKAYAVR